MPADWQLGIVPASDTGAMEMAMWSLLGPLPVDVLAFDSFSEQWASDAIVRQSEASRRARASPGPYGTLPDLCRHRPGRTTWCSPGTARPPACAWPTGRGCGAAEGLVICDATSAAFAMDLPWDRLDVVTWSWQKALGGEAGHGMLAMSPRALERLSTHAPAWPLPKIFRIVPGIFRGDTINTPSMLCVADALDGLRWAERQGGLPALIARAEANLAVVAAWEARSPWASFLAADPAQRSPTSICLRAAAGPVVAKRLEAEGVAHDIAAYRDAPPGLRIWGGATVETADIEALLPWLDWAQADASAASSAMV